MPTQAPPTPDLMPSGETLAAEAITELIAEGYTSSLMKLPRPVLNELARQLVNDWPTSEVLEKWLLGKGHDVPDRNIRRFVRRFRETFKLVWGKHADAQIAAELAADPRFDAVGLRQVNRNRIQHIIAQKLLTTTPEDLDPKALATFIRGIRLEDVREHDTESLKLAAEQSAARVAKLKADLALSQREAERRETKLNADLTLLEQRSKLLQQQVEEAERKHRQAIESAKAATTKKATADGGKLTEADVLSILDQAMKGEL